MEQIKVFPLGKIDAAFILEKGFEEARKQKDLLWSTKFQEARESARLTTSEYLNIWSLIRAAETELWIYLSDDNAANLEKAQKAMTETLDFVEYCKVLSAT